MADPLSSALAEILAPVASVTVEDDGALTVRHDGTVASLRTVAIAEGLEMVSLTQMLAWDLPWTAELTESVAALARTTTLGTVSLAGQPDGCADVVLRYNFPGGGLRADALRTLILMVLAGGAEARRALS